MTQRITIPRIDAVITKLKSVQGAIDKMRLGDTMAADSERIKHLREARGFIDDAILETEKARPLR